MGKKENKKSLKGKIIYINQNDMKFYYPKLNFIGFVPDSLGWAMFCTNNQGSFDYKSIRPLIVYEESRSKCLCTELWGGVFKEEIIQNKNLEIDKFLIDGEKYNKNYFDGLYMLIKKDFLNNLPIKDSFIDTSLFFQIEKDYLYNFVDSYHKCIKISNNLDFNNHLDLLVKIFITSKEKYDSISLHTIDINVLNNQPTIEYDLNNKAFIKQKLTTIDFLTFEKVDKTFTKRKDDVKNISFMDIKENYFTFIANNWKQNFIKYKFWQDNIKQSIYSLVYDEINKRTRLFEKENISDERKDEFITNWILDKNKVRNNNELILKVFNDVQMNKKENNKFLYNAFNNQINAYKENKLIGLDGKPLERKEGKKIWVPSR